MTDYDDIIVGQGIAGTTLAWQLHWHGSNVLVIDRDEPGTASKVAAGLLTPITGQRFVKSWRWDEFWPAASSFYRRVEDETNTRFFRTNSMIRLFANDEERTLFESKRAAEYADIIRQPIPLVDHDSFRNPFGGFEMTQAGRLDVACFLESSHRHFEAAGKHLVENVETLQLEFSGDKVSVPRLEVRANRLFFCQGFSAVENPWFAPLKFDATKGEILTLRVPNLSEDRIVHRGVWLAPIGDGVFRAGATYHWSPLDSQPTKEAREEICNKLRQFLCSEFEVISQQAAVRPVLVGRRPVAGLHPEESRLGFFNGLASKGALQAPLLAEQFVEHLAGSYRLDDEINFTRRAKF